MTPQALPLDVALQQAVAHHQGGRLQDAERLYRAILKAHPNHPDANHSLGVLAMQVKQPTGALPHFKAALEANPEHGQHWLSYIDALIQAGRVNAARLILQQGMQHGLQGKAVEALAQLLEKSGPSPQEMDELETLFADGTYTEAVALAHRLAERFPMHGYGWKALGSVLSKMGQNQEALVALHKATALMPGDAEAHNNLGVTLKTLGQLNDAEVSYRRALGIRPDYPEAHNNLGLTLQDLGQLNEAAASYHQALAIRPDYPEAHSNLLYTLRQRVNQSPASFLEEALQYGRRVAAKSSERYNDWHCPTHPQRLRVGLVSGDLRNHPIGYFLEDLLAHIDSTRVELFAYPTTHKADELTDRLRRYFMAWQPLVGLSDKDAARLIQANGVHVLLDLSGHTANNRLPVFALKPAPIQASWLGFMATTGVAEMDFILGDPVATPPKDEPHFSEKVWRFPEVYCCFTPPNVDVVVGQLPALLTTGITFGSFNNLAKMNEQVVGLWARVLHAVPCSRLFLKTKQLDNIRVCEEIQRRYAAHGIEDGRLILEGYSPRAELLGAYNRVDIALDPFPYNGGTTNYEALWMGVPFITRQGNSLLSRAGQSIAYNAGLPNWIALDDDDYVAKALAHTVNLRWLADLRYGLRQQVLASPLFDAQRFARYFETAMWGMWDQSSGQSGYRDS